MQNETGASFVITAILLSCVFAFLVEMFSEQISGYDRRKLDEIIDGAGKGNCFTRSFNEYRCK